MTADYTPGHAYNDVRAFIGEAPGDAEALIPILTVLYKAGQANERAAIVVGLRAKRRIFVEAAGLLPDAPFGDQAELVEMLADMIERGEL